MDTEKSGKTQGKIRLGDLADIAGVSIATVSRALNDHPAVNPETKRRVWRIARENDYAFRPTMPAMLSGAAATILVVIPAPQGRANTIADPFYLELIGGVGAAARESRCDLLISHIDPQSHHDLSYLVGEHRADGVIFLGQSVLHDRFNRLAATEPRFVVWGAEMSDQKYCSVGSDNLRGGRRATSHLLRMGRRKIAFLGDTGAAEVRQRYQGYLAALSEAGVEPDPNLAAPVHFEVESAEASVTAMLAQDQAFDAIFAANDFIAMGAIRALTRAGLRVPEDVSVIGYDNVQMARYGRPALSTISQDMTRAGRLMVSKLLDTPPNQSIPSERLATDLIIRESCGG
ncbi:MAG: LacI family DNA-binding transcriptional regulator [Pseudomonadota bacterium]